MLHLSTSYVFAGDKAGPYFETDIPGPACVYGLTKLSGEMAIQKATDNHVILRTAWVYSPFSGNFVKTMLQLGETRDEINVVADRDPVLRGLFHLTGQGETTRAGFAEAILVSAAARGLKPVWGNEIPTSAYPAPARRPANSRLSGEKLFTSFGLRLDPWQKSLEDCLDQLINKPEERE